MLRAWENLPQPLQVVEVLPYYQYLKTRTISLLLKRTFDILLSALMIIFISPALFILSAWIYLDSEGGVLYRQIRVTKYGREFNVYKFRTMVVDADKIGGVITEEEDPRITRAGKKIRKVRLDELPQLFNIIKGDMSFVGTRPEVPKFVACYTPEMMATLLMPAGLTSNTSVRFRDESKLLSSVETANAEEAYIKFILPAKMKYNLEELLNFSITHDFAVIFKTAKAMLRR